MDLIVEDGTLVEDANSYTELAFADVFMALRGIVAWAKATEESRIAALIRATDVLNSYRWKAEPVDPSRAMSWPRVGMFYFPDHPVPASVVPLQVKYAQCELAASIVVDGAVLMAQVDTSKGAVTSERVDVVAVSYGDPTTNSYTGITGFPAVDGLLRPFLLGFRPAFGIVEMGRG